MAAEVAHFAEHVPVLVEEWTSQIRSDHAAGRRVVLWGGGSKGVAFLTTLGLTDEIAGVVDINPNKANTFMAGSGHRIVAPSTLTEIRPDVVIVMNPIYTNEISAELSALGIDAEIRPIE